jgi:hypothetical protein
MSRDARHRHHPVASAPFSGFAGLFAGVLVLASLLSGCWINWNQQAPAEVNRENHRGYGP